MDNQPLPDDCAKQWDVLLLLLATEEKNLGITANCEVNTMEYFCKRQGVNTLFKHWLAQMKSSYANKVTETDTATKSEAISQYWRMQGNESFNKGDVMDSYSCYTKSVLYAEPEGNMYPLALANRSAALLHMKRFEECLMDIELAFKYGYPIEQHLKMFLRRTDCYMKLGHPAKAKEALELANECFKCLNEDHSQITEFQGLIKALDDKLKTIKQVEVSAESDVLPSFLEEENVNFVCASNSLVIRDKAKYGRHVITEKPAQRGDIFFDEKAYAFVAIPLENNLAIVCEACCRLEINIVPCKQCSRSVYCSETCRDEAWRVFHQWECVGAQATLFPTIGIAHLALRVLLVSADKGFPPITMAEGAEIKVADVFKDYSRFDSTQIYKRDMPEFYRMFYLVTNFKKMKVIDFLQYALTASMLTLYLEHHTTFFEHLQSQLPFALGSDDIKLFCAAMLLKHMGQLVCNGHAAQTLTTFIPEELGFGGSKSVCERELRYSTAIYPSASMMNHSCDHNTINNFYRDRLIIRSGGDLPAGGELYNCYGPHKSRDTYNQRRIQLYQQYCFACECNTCKDLERRDFVLLFSAFSCQSCKGAVIRCENTLKCVQCKTTNYDLMKASRIMERADYLYEQAQTCPQQQVCDKFSGVLKLKQQVLYKHNMEIRQTIDDLARLYTENGDFVKSIELLKQNIQSAEYQYGSFSVEVTYELRKLADVMHERMIRSTRKPLPREWCLETNKVLKKAIKLMELNYGAWENVIGRLRIQEAKVEGLLKENWPQAYSLHQNMHYNLKI